MPSGKPSRFIWCAGRFYERVSIGRYRRVEASAAKSARQVLPTTIMHRLEDGSYMRTHYCVQEVACPYPCCKAPLGTPCRGVMGGLISSTHYRRRDAARDKRRGAA